MSSHLARTGDAGDALRCVENGEAPVRNVWGIHARMQCALSSMAPNEGDGGKPYVRGVCHDELALIDQM